MRVIIAGSRNITSYNAVKLAVKRSKFKISKVISGGANGVDSLGERYANENRIEVEIFNADWDLWGKRAGFVRNSKMANNADALIAIWDGKSRGTKHMIDVATEKGLKVFIYIIKWR